MALGLRRIPDTEDSKVISSVTQKNFDSIAGVINTDILKRITDIENILDTNGVSLTQMLYSARDHVCDIKLAGSHAAGGGTYIEFDTQTRIENDYFSWKISDPTKIYIRKAGSYKVYFNIVADGAFVATARNVSTDIVSLTISNADFNGNISTTTIFDVSDYFRIYVTGSANITSATVILERI